MSKLIQRAHAAQSVIDEYYKQPLVWGKSDCAHLAAAVIIKLGHANPFKGIQKYTSETGAFKAMRRAGFTTLAEAVEKLGFESIPPVSALSGDIVGYPGQGFGGVALGVAIGDGRFLGFAAGPDGQPICDHAKIADVAALGTMMAWRVTV